MGITLGEAMMDPVYPNADPDEQRKREAAARAKAESARAESELARIAAESARAEAEASNLRFSFLAEASRVLAGSLDYETTLQNVARLVVPQLGDFCVVDLAEDGKRIRRVAVADVDPKREELVWRIAREHPLSVHSPPTYSKVFSTGQSEWLPEVTDEMCLALPEDADPEVMRSLKFRSFICVPLPVHGQILGTISIARSKQGRSYTSVDLAVAEELARRAGLAVDHARLYRISQDANRIKDEFLATLSHELRSPLSSALLCAQMLRRGVLDPEKTARALETIERKIRMEVRLVDDLVDISRITAGKISLKMEAVELVGVVHAAIEAIRSAAEKQNIRLSFTPHEFEAFVHGDEVRLEQVVTNLLSNAFKFTPEGGSIDVTLEQVGRDIAITVHDTGIGISPKMLPGIFDRFQQRDSSLTRRYGGLGLGLAIVHRLVELHGGRVTAESAGEGHGTTFTVVLPLLPARPYVVSPPTIGDRDVSVDLADLSGIRVLVVDDDEDARESMAALLTTCGATVTTAAAAREALEILERAEKVQDVMLSDLSMPDVDGYELLRAIHARSPGGAATIPAIAVTAYAGTRDRELALAAGYRSYLSKPVDQSGLVAAVAALAGRRPPPGDEPNFG